jgi:ADP-ribosyl-[dinitrogen reductase] hydrolase
VAAAVDGSLLGRSRADVSSSGFVTATLDAALWSVAGTGSFEEALVLAVNLGDDADTVGAVAGQIAGASYGASAIPERWLRNLAWRERIEDLAMDLAHGKSRGDGLLGRLLGR